MVSLPRTPNYRTGFDGGTTELAYGYLDDGVSWCVVLQRATAIAEDGKKIQASVRGAGARRVELGLPPFSHLASKRA